MSLTNAAETAILQLLFTNTNWSNIGDATGLRGSSAAGSWHISLHTADPGEAGDQTTSEISYTGYARVAVARNAAWTVTGASVSPAANIDFGAMTGGAGGTVTHFGIGTAASGTGNLIFKGAVTPNIVVTTGVTPRLTTATAVTAD
jgi:hypothetical protein